MALFLLPSTAPPSLGALQSHITNLPSTRRRCAQPSRIPGEPHTPKPGIPQHTGLRGLPASGQALNWCCASPVPLQGVKYLQLRWEVLVEGAVWGLLHLHPRGRAVGAGRGCWGT